MLSQSPPEAWEMVLTEVDEREAFARMLYVSSGGFVDWQLLPEDGQTKTEYRSNASRLIELLDLHRRTHGNVVAPLEPTLEMVEAGYRAMLAIIQSRREKPLAPKLQDEDALL